MNEIYIPNVFRYENIRTNNYEEVVSNIPYFIDFDLNDENKEVILCTDGFWEHFNDGTVIDLMKDNPESNLAKFTKNIPGNAENHTVCYVRFPS